MTILKDDAALERLQEANIISTRPGAPHTGESVARHRTCSIRRLRPRCSCHDLGRPSREAHAQRGATQSRTCGAVLANDCGRAQGETQRVSYLSKMSWHRNTQRVRAA